MKKIFLLFIALGFVVLGFSQQKKAAISFESNVHDFGTFKEEHGPITYVFKFTNTGGEPLILSKVKASCGCTTPVYTKVPVKPGKTGEIKVTYNPRNRPGNFNKSITVFSNAETPTKVLRITGKVTPRKKTIVDIYPQKMGDLRLKSNHLAFTKVKNTQIKTDSLAIVNTSSSPMTVTFTSIPQNIEITTEPKVLKPNKVGHIVAKYNASKKLRNGKQDWGFLIDRVPMVINGEKNSRYRLTISATIQEDFSVYKPEDLKDAPKIEFQEKVYNFGTIKQNDVVEHEFKFKNTGKKDLIIRKIKASCGCTATSTSSDIVKPGEDATIKAVFNSRGKRGKQNKTITVITNTPAGFQNVLRITGTVNVPHVKANNNNQVKH